MATIYNDMGRFLQESFSIDDTFKKLSDKKLNESLKESIGDNDLTEIFLKYHEDADNFRANQSGFDAMYEILSKYGDPDEYVDEVFKRAPREEQLKMVSLITPRNMDESLKEDFSDARPAATKIFNFIEMGADPAAILDELLRFLPDDALVDFADYYGENFLGIGDDWE